MKKKTILFDLGGTLLPMDQDQFTTSYFKLLAAKLAPYGYKANELVGNLWAGTAAMVKNDGSRSNEKAFWAEFSRLYGEKALEDMPLFEEFYGVDFQRAKQFCGFNPQAGETVRQLKDQGHRVVLATNPIFPSIATNLRIRWVGLEPEDFELITTYENSTYCKPNPLYYQEVLDKIGCQAADCLMVGNDVTEDGAAGKTGMDVFLLTDCLINREEKDISAFPQGSFPELRAYIESL